MNTGAYVLAAPMDSRYQGVLVSGSTPAHGGIRISHEPRVSCGWIANSLSPESISVLFVPSRKSEPAIRMTKTMCHQTLTWLSIATIRIPTILRTSCPSIRTAIVRSWPEISNVSPIFRTSVVLVRALFVSGLMIVWLRKNAAAKLMPDTIANWPIRLNQAVHQPQFLFFIFDAQ